MPDYRIEMVDGVAMLMPDNRRATLVEEALWKHTLSSGNYKEHFAVPYARRGASICSKHDFVLSEIRRLASKPQFITFRETFYRLEQVLVAAFHDGQAMERAIRRHSAANMTLEDSMRELAKDVKSALEEALKTTQSRRAEMQLRLTEHVVGSAALLAVSQEAEAMDRECARILRALHEVNHHIQEEPVS